MIIPQARRRILDGIKLDSWLRAPLSLNDGATFYSVHEILRQRVSSTEIVISTINPTYWQDLWRIEIETYDTPGVLAAIFEIFRENGLKAIASEGSINTFNEVNTMAFIVSATHYTSTYDGDTVERMHTENCSLKELELVLTINLFEQVTLNEKNWPKIKVRRFDEYRRLALDMQPRQVRELAAVTGEELRDGHFVLSDRILSRLKQSVSEDPLYTAHVDTKLRLIRLHVFPEDEPFRHLQLLIRHNTAACLQQVFGHIFELNGNVIKYQLRQGSNLECSETPRSCSRIDITYGPKGNTDAKIEKLEERLIEVLKRDPLLSASEMALLKTSAQGGLINGE